MRVYPPPNLREERKKATLADLLFLLTHFLLILRRVPFLTQPHAPCRYNEVQESHHVTTVVLLPLSFISVYCFFHGSTLFINLHDCPATTAAAAGNILRRDSSLAYVIDLLSSVLVTENLHVSISECG